MLVGYIRPLPRHSEAKQREALEFAGVKRIYVEGDEGEGLAEAIRSLRKGDKLVVLQLAFLAGSKQVQGSRRAALFQALQAAEERGASVFEAATVRDTATDRDAMLLDAIDWLAGQAKAVNGAKSGRPPKTFSPDVVQAAKAAWLSVRYRRIEDVERHLPAGFSVWRCYRMFGARNGAED